jgi:hypothetical protein
MTMEMKEKTYSYPISNFKLDDDFNLNYCVKRTVENPRLNRLLSVDE